MRIVAYAGLAVGATALLARQAAAEHSVVYDLGQYPCAVGSSSTGDADAQASFLSGDTLSDCPQALQPVYPFNKINIRAPDDSVRASFIPYGATIVDFWTRDREGTWRDILLGLDNTTSYRALVQTAHPYLGPVVGRYANRIRNGTFQVDGKTFHVPLNEKNVSTLHGGADGYDERSFTIESLSDSHVSFVMTDVDGNQGFPGTVIARANYSLHRGGEFIMQLDANVTSQRKRTPIMLSAHQYWALHGYKDAKNTILNHTLEMPYADKYIKTDGILIPTGPILKVKGTPLDFTQPRTFNERYEETQGLCGTGCQGWDNCFVMSKGHPREKYVLTLTSPESGIRLRATTNQAAIQIYTCNGIQATNGTSIPRKFSQGGDAGLSKVYENHSCAVIEMQDYIDAINNPAWGRDQIYSRERPYHWRAEYKFDTVD